MIASLPMYDRPETAAANDRFWNSILGHLGEDPFPLTRGEDTWDVWRSSDLLVSQTCGLPFRQQLKDKVTLIGTPDYGLPDCPPGYYASVIVTRADSGFRTLYELNGGVMAVNARHSQSGFAAPLNAGLRPQSVIETGGHIASARAVCKGAATFAAIDAQSWRMMLRWDDFASDLMVLARTEPTPGLPFITARNRDPEPLRAAIRAAISDLGATDRDLLNLKALVQIPRADYLSIPTPPVD